MATATKKILISESKNKYALVDEADFEWLNQWKWHYTGQSHKKGYAQRVERTKISHDKTIHQVIKMHRLLAGAKEGQVVDHINHDTLDNRRSNLRICSQRQNIWNRPKGSTNKSGFKGVTWRNNRCGKKNWYASIGANSKRHCLGYFYTPKEAALAYDQAAVKLHGAFASTNGLEV